MRREMFSTNLIQSNYGDLNIKSLAFDSFKERLQSTMTALTFFISTGQCDCDEIAESNFNYMIAYMSNINYDASKPGAPALSFDTYLQDNVKYKVIINNLYGSEIRIRGINKDFIGMDVTSVFRPEKMTNLLNIKNRLVIHYLRTIYYCLLYTSPSPRDEYTQISYAVFCLKKKKKKKKKKQRQTNKHKNTKK